MKRKIIIFLLIIMFIGIRIIYADTIETIRYDNVYAVYDGVDRERLFNGERYEVNGNTLYCIEPLLPVGTGNYIGTDNYNITNLSDEVINYIRLVSYYGYDYPGHNTRDYYLAAQELIWEKITGRSIYWIIGTNRNNEIDITYEKNNILNLINTYKMKPSFSDDEIVVNLGNNLELIDENDIISEYEIVASDIKGIVIDGNILKVDEANNIKTGIIKLKRKSYTNQKALVYYNSTYQKLIKVGIPSDNEILLKIKLNIQAKLKVIKKDMDTGYPIHINNIYFEIKNLDTGEKVCESDDCLYKTNRSGELITNNFLNEGTYEISEIDDQRISGYLVNQEKVTFTIARNSNFEYINNEPYIVMIHPSKPVIGRLKILTYGEGGILNDNTFNYQKILLNNVSYILTSRTDIYRADGRLLYLSGTEIQRLSTDNGVIILDNMVPNGMYCLVQEAVEDNHILNEEAYCFTFRRINYKLPVLEVEVEINNKIKKGNLEITKYDEKNQALAMAEIDIYDESDNLIYSGITNSEGVINLYNIPSGNYYYIERKAPLGYQIDNNEYYFEVVDNLDIKLSLLNTLIRVPDTYKENNYMIIYLLIIFGGCFILINDKIKKY